MNWSDAQAVLPELILTGSALLLLVLESLNSPPRSRLGWLALVGLGLAILPVIFMPVNGRFFSGMIAVDEFSRFFDAIFLVLATLSVLVAINYLRKHLEERGEYYAILLFATIGMMLMAKADNLIITFLGLELLSISLYILVGFFRTRTSSNEGALKYLLLGAFSTGFFLFGIALVYGGTGTTNYNEIVVAITHGNQAVRALSLAGFGLLLVGFAFKVALAPFHMYAPDVYEGAPSAVTALLSTGPKIAGFAALLKITVVSFSSFTPQWWGIMWVLAVLTMTVGNISALLQTNLKRMLAYSSVAHAGYLVIAILVSNYDSAFAITFYLAVYGITTLAAFAIITVLEQQDETGLTVDDYSGLARRNPILAGAFALAMLSLAGFPPTAGFLGKYFIFSAAVDEGYLWLIIIAVINSLISVAYYLRPVVAMYMADTDVTEPIGLPGVIVPILIALLIVSLGFGIFPMGLVQLCTSAAGVLF